MSEREWRFYLDDMISFVEKVLAYSNGLDQDGFVARLSGLARFLPLNEIIESFWLEPINQQSHSWTGHRDINSVMLATSLASEGYLVLQ